MSLAKAEELDQFQSSCRADHSNSMARRDFLYIEESNAYMTVIEEFIKQHSIFNNTTIIQLHPSAENGYPHTRPNNIICIPNTASFPNLQSTLFHEAVHIHQRTHTNEWSIFLKAEGWLEVSKSDIPERWRERCRYNPDTFLHPFWIYMNRYIPLPLFIRPHSPLFHEIDVMWYDIHTGKLEHTEPEVFSKKYGSNRQSEHPYEIYAVLLETHKVLTEEFLNSYISIR